MQNSDSKDGREFYLGVDESWIMLDTYSNWCSVSSKEIIMKMEEVTIRYNDPSSYPEKKYSKAS